MAALLVGLILLVKALYPVDLPTKASPSFIDTIFDNRFVIWAARLLLVSAAASLPSAASSSPYRSASE